MARTSATVTKSLQDAKKELNRFIKTLDRVPKRILNQEAKQIYAEAIAETPFKTGKLEKSVYVKVSQSKTSPGLVAGASAKDSYGYDYAGIQHENTKFHHPIKGKAHYISDPFRRGTVRIKQRFDKEIRL